MKKSSNTTKTWFFDDASKNILKTEQFATKFMHYVFAGVILFLLATIVYSFFGFNLSNELKTHSVISVDYKNTLTASEYTQIEKEMNAIISDNGEFTVDFERGGYVTNTRLTVKLINDNYSKVKLQTILSQIKNDIEDNWSTILNLEVSEPATHTPYYYQEVVSAIILSSIIVAALFVFMWVRHELVSALSIIIASVYNTAVLFSLLLLLRIPLTLGFLSFFTVSIVVSTLTYIIISDGVRKLELSNKKLTNAKAVHIAASTVLPIILMILLAIVAISLPITIYFLIMGWTAAYTIISLVISVFFGVFVGLIFTPTCWATFYNREKDKRLKLKIEKQAEKSVSKSSKRKATAEEEEKIIV